MEEPLKNPEIIASAATRDLNDAELAEINQYLTGLDAHLGFVYTHAGPDGMSLKFSVEKHHLQPFGLVHGGMFAAVGESLGSMAGFFAAGGYPVVGVNNNTDFLRSVTEGIVEAHCTAIHTGRSTQVWEIRMLQEEKLIARTTLRTMVLRG